MIFQRFATKCIPAHLQALLKNSADRLLLNEQRESNNPYCELIFKWIFDRYKVIYYCITPFLCITLATAMVTSPRSSASPATILSLLRTGSSTEFDYFKAARRGNAQDIQEFKLLACCTNLNKQEHGTGNTVMHYALLREDLALIHILLSVKDIKLTIPNDAGHTALDLVKDSINSEVIKLFNTHNNKKKNTKHPEQDTAVVPPHSLKEKKNDATNSHSTS